MIDVKKTIFHTLSNKIDKLRFLGKTDPVGFKKLLYLIILDDLYDWSDYLDESQSILKKLQQLRNNFILCNKEFIIKYKDVVDGNNNVIVSAQPYVNVNTPLTNDTWKRIWDNSNTVVYHPSMDVADEYLTGVLLNGEYIQLDTLDITSDGYIKIK